MRDGWNPHIVNCEGGLHRGGGDKDRQQEQQVHGGGAQGGGGEGGLDFPEKVSLYFPIPQVARLAKSVKEERESRITWSKINKSKK